MRTKRILSTLIVFVMLIGLLPNFVFATETGNSDYLVNATSSNIYEATRTDFRDESVYTLLITRFYDGDRGNNVHCWDDAQAGNPDSDPAWRGDFKGLIEKLDYIKALGFTAVRLNPVAQNASGYDYHGEHPVNFKKIDMRYESDGYTYQDLVNACHTKGLKVIQNVVLNSSSNFGEENLAKLFDINPKADPSNMKEIMVPTQLLLDTYGISSIEEYWEQKPFNLYQQRLNMLKNTTDFSGTSNTTGDYPADSDYETTKLSTSKAYNPNNYYHSGYFQSLNWDNWTNKYSQTAGDCVDINTENYTVGLYLAETCKMYADYGVDAIYIKDARQITRLSLNLNIIEPLKEMLAKEGKQLDIFAEVETRVFDTWYREHATESTQFYTWADDAEWKQKWSYKSDLESVNNNMNITFDFIKETNDITEQPTSNNVLLNGITYHTPDYSQSSGVNVFDFTMHMHFGSARNAFTAAKSGDMYYNDSTWNITGVETEDYSPGAPNETRRFDGGTNAWLENLSLLFTFRGIPSIIQGTEVEFQKGQVIDASFTKPLSETGRAYYGDYLDGSVEATDFGNYSANGTVATTLGSRLSRHIQMLNKVRQQVPALRKGQYTTDSNYVSGDMAFIRRYTDADVDSLALVTITSGATFTNIPNGKYVDAVSGNVETVTNGTLTVEAPGTGNLAVYVCCAEGFTAIDAEFEIDRYSATFDANGGDGTMDTAHSAYGYITLPKCTFTAPEGKIFKAWSVDGSEYTPGNVVKVTEDVTVKAIWKDIIYRNISFESNGGSGNMEGLRILEGQYTLPECTFKAPYGMSFKAWSVGDKEYATGATINVTSDIQVKALWQDIIIELTGRTVKVSGLSTSAKLIVASYFGSKLVDVKTLSVSGYFEQTHIGLGLNLTNADTVKAFLWNNMNAIAPLCDPQTVSINSTDVESDNLIYFKNTNAWDTVNAYYWGDSEFVSWPGEKMNNISGTDIWYIEVPVGAVNIIFNNGSYQTGDLEVPTDSNNLYTYNTNTWSEYNNN